LIICRERFFKPPLFVEHDTAIVRGVRKFRIERKCPIVGCQRLVEPFQFLERIAAVTMRCRKIWIYFQREIDLANRLVVRAPVVIGDPQQMQTIDVPRLSSQNFSIKLFGFRQHPGLVKCDGLLQQ
jgi:hypothetical protein